jgi:phosphate uptake regulator
MIRFDNHAFKGLDKSLQQLYELVNDMGKGVETLIGMLPSALDEANPETFAQAKAIDKTINTAELAVDAAVTSMINKFTIMGEDLRFTLGCLKVAGTLERTADKIKNCAKRLSRVSHPLEARVKAELSKTVNAVQAMVPLTLSLLIDYREEVPQTLLQHGATVQNAYRSIVVMLHAHTNSADDETHILLVAKNLEQSADMLIEIMKLSHYVHFATKYEKAALVS